MLNWESRRIRIIFRKSIVAFVWVDLLEVVQAPANFAHVHLEDLAPIGEVLNDVQDFGGRVFQPLGSRP